METNCYYATARTEVDFKSSGRYDFFAKKTEICPDLTGKAPNGLALNRQLIVEPVGLNRYLKRFDDFVNRFANGLGL